MCTADSCNQGTRSGPMYKAVSTMPLTKPQLSSACAQLSMCTAERFSLSCSVHTIVARLWVPRPKPATYSDPIPSELCSARSDAARVVFLAGFKLGPVRSISRPQAVHLQHADACHNGDSTSARRCIKLNQAKVQDCTSVTQSTRTRTSFAKDIARCTNWSVY